MVMLLRKYHKKMLNTTKSTQTYETETNKNMPGDT